MNTRNTDEFTVVYVFRASRITIVHVHVNLPSRQDAEPQFPLRHNVEGAVCGAHTHRHNFHASQNDTDTRSYRIEQFTVPRKANIGGCGAGEARRGKAVKVVLKRGVFRARSVWFRAPKRCFVRTDLAEHVCCRCRYVFHCRSKDRRGSASFGPYTYSTVHMTGRSCADRVCVCVCVCVCVEGATCTARAHPRALIDIPALGSAAQARAFAFS